MRYRRSFAIVSLAGSVEKVPLIFREVLVSFETISKLALTFCVLTPFSSCVRLGVTTKFELTPEVKALSQFNALTAGSLPSRT